MKTSRRDFLEAAIADQVKWINERTENPESSYFGEDGADIFEADVQELRRLQKLFCNSLPGRGVRPTNIVAEMRERVEQKKTKPELRWRRTTEVVPVSYRPVIGFYSSGSGPSERYLFRGRLNGLYLMVGITIHFQWFKTAPFEYVEAPEFWLPVSALPPLPEDAQRSLGGSTEISSGQGERDAAS